jgi:hypothetical protein
VQHTLGADLEIAGVDADKAIGVIFSYDGKLDPKLDAHFQAALLYTSADGQRRVRCINVVAAVNEGGMETMKYVDQDAVVSVIAKEGKLTMQYGLGRVANLLIHVSQLLRRLWTRISRTFVPTFPRRRSISSADTARSSQAHIHLASWSCRRI